MIDILLTKDLVKRVNVSASNFFIRFPLIFVQTMDSQTYGSDTFVLSPIISMKLLSQSFFLFKSKLSTDNMICKCKKIVSGYV